MPYAPRADSDGSDGITIVIININTRWRAVVSCKLRTTLPFGEKPGTCAV
jgi:hypothetical protein